MMRVLMRVLTRVVGGLAALSALSLAPAATQAASVTFSQSFPGGNNPDPGQGAPVFSPTDWDGTQSVTLPQFDPALGTLTDVDLSLYGGISASGALTNTGADPVTISRYTATLDISMPVPGGAVPVLTVSPVLFDISSPLTLAAGQSFLFGADAPVTTSDTGAVSPDDTSFYLGPGTLTLPLTATTNASTPTPNDALQITRENAAARALVSVTYTYDPAAAPVGVPEPASPALLGAGLLCLGLLRRRL